MSAIYKRSMGMTYNDRELAKELGGGVSGYATDETVPTTPYALPVELDWETFDAQVEALLAEEAMRAAEERMEEVAIEHPKYTRHVGTILSDWLERMSREGKPVDAEMFVEAPDLAQEIVAANPDKNADELREVVEAMLDMIQAEHRLRQYTLAA
jgi:hypothetical protein